jgi:D-aminoacyl-tRNA deacylase
MLGVVASRADEASVRIAEQLRAVAEWKQTAAGEPAGWRTDGAELREIEEIHVEMADPAPRFSADPDLVAVVSRHAGDTGPLLTAHHTGNVGPADYGGEPQSFAPAAPAAHRRALGALSEYAPDGYAVGTEATHHGPTDISVPFLFVELGSDEPQWRDNAAAEAVARATLALRGVKPRTERSVAVFGGGHYAPRVERLVRETDWSVGHVAPDWGIETLDSLAARAETFERLLAASGTRLALVDGDRPALTEALDRAGATVVSETWLRETDGVALDLAERLETALGPVVDGTRFGSPARTAAPDIALKTRRLPPGLAEAAGGVDAAAATDAVASEALAYGTADGGSRPAGRVALAVGDGYDRIVTGLVAVLREQYDDVTVTDDRVVARRLAFDPERARTLGVPEGPAFGRLADGEAVEVRGELIPPEQVSRERVDEFEIPDR